ncbi:5800_t:CDS:2, partial [Scutellospora calospora]
PTDQEYYSKKSSIQISKPVQKCYNEDEDYLLKIQWEELSKTNIKPSPITTYNHTIITDNTPVTEEPSAQDLNIKKVLHQTDAPKNRSRLKKEKKNKKIMTLGLCTIIVFLMIIRWLSHKENNKILYLPIPGIKESFSSKIATNNLPEGHLKVKDRLVNIRN